MKKIIRQLHRNIPNNIWRIFKKNNVMLAGGTFERLLTNNDINDLDLYFNTPINVYRTVMELIDAKYVVVGKTNRSLVMKDKEGVPINIIYMDFFKNLDEVFNMFDFECCKAGFDFKNDTFNCSPLFWETLHTKTLTYTGSRYPLGALIRLSKYVKRGYTPEYTSILKLYRDLKTLNTDDTAVVEEHIGGIYGCNVDLKGLNLDQIIEKLDNTLDYEKPATVIDNAKVENIFEHLFTQKAFIYSEKDQYSDKPKDYLMIVHYCDNVMIGMERSNIVDDISKFQPVQFPIVLGKWVRKLDDGVYVSHIDKTFSYVENEIVESKNPKYGLFVGIDEYRDSIPYHEKSNSAYCLIEVQSPEDFIQLTNNRNIQIKKGKVLKILDKENTTIVDNPNKNSSKLAVPVLFDTSIINIKPNFKFQF